MGLFSKKRMMDLFLFFPIDQNGEANDPEDLKEGDELAVKVALELVKQEPAYIGDLEGLNIEPKFLIISKLQLDSGERPITCYDSRKKQFTDMEEVKLMIMQGTYFLLLHKGVPENQLQKEAGNYHFAVLPKYGLCAAFRVYKA